ncbi:hypothetical protein Tco_0820728 [Tanacetum coccineum]|uniref:Uncharacterized protein n=1 Tax=Tanacetum coccineum TaxID=301880 RepID=A0ABQ5AEZ5_9ASTR
MWSLRAGRHDPLSGGILSAGRQDLQPGVWEVVRGIFLLDFAFKVLLELCLAVGLHSLSYLYYNLILGPVTTKEKVQKKNDVKARSMLLMALPNEHLMTYFNQYKESAKTLFAAIKQTRYWCNESHKANLEDSSKANDENFIAPKHRVSS